MNANPCSATIWPEMGESAALTTGLEAESISAHFLDHLVPHPKRGKCGLYHAPTLSFCHSTPGSKLGKRGRADCAGSPPGPRAELPGRAGDPRLHLHPPAIALMGRERPWRGEWVHPPPACRAHCGRPAPSLSRELGVRRPVVRSSLPTPDSDPGGEARPPSLRAQSAPGPAGRGATSALSPAGRDRPSQRSTRFARVSRRPPLGRRVGNVPFVRIYGERLQ